MKILHVIPSYIPVYKHGGPVKGVHDLCRMLVNKGHQVSVFTTNSDRSKKLDVLLGKTHYIDGVEVNYYPVKFWRNYYYSSDLSKALKKHIQEFDIAHIHSVFLYPTRITSYWCKKKNIPYLINPFGALDSDMINLKSSFLKRIYIKLIETSNINNAAMIHLASEYEKKRFLCLEFDVPTAVVARGIFLKEYERQLAGKSLQIIYPQLRGKKIILFLGRIHPKKGLEKLGLAFKEIIKKKKDVRLVITGDGEKEYVKKIKSFYKKLGLLDKTVFTGMLLGEEKLSAFYSSEIFVLSSYGENFGIAALEAMACGLPVVISKKVGLFSDVKEYQTGFVVGNEVADIERAIEEIIDNRKLKDGMAQNSKKLIQDKFGIDKITDQMVKVYQEIIKK